MFDCGEGTQTQLMKSDLKAGKLSKIFITHLHGDHLYGISGLLCTISQSNQRFCPVDIYGPLGLAKYLRVTLGLSRSELGFQYRVYEMVPTPDMYADDDRVKCNIDVSDQKALHPRELPGGLIEAQFQRDIPYWTLIDEGPIKVVAGELLHKIPSFGFVCTEDALPGGFDLVKLKSFGLSPGPVCGKLMQGETVTTDGGLTVTLKDVTKPSRKGRRVVICGDSSDSCKLAPLAEDADIYVHEATLQNSMMEMAVERGHSTPAMAAKFAQLAGARILYLTHFSQRYTVTSSAKDTDLTIDDLKLEAQEVFGENVLVAEDLQTYEIVAAK